MALGSLSSMVQGLDPGSSMNLAAMLAQAGVQDPEGLASRMASLGIAPPPVPITPSAGLQAPTQIAGQIADKAQSATAPLPQPGGALPLPAPALPSALPLPTPGAPIPGAGGGAGGGLLEALAGLKKPEAPAFAQPPGVVAPRPGGGQPNPQLLAQLMQLLKGAQAPSTPSLGSLIAGKSAAPNISI